MSDAIALAREEVLRITGLFPEEEFTEELEYLDTYLAQEDARLALGDEMPVVDGAQFGGPIDAPALVQLSTAALVLAHGVIEFYKAQKLEKMTEVVLSHAYMSELRKSLEENLRQSGLPEDRAKVISEELGSRIG